MSDLRRVASSRTPLLRATRLPPVPECLGFMVHFISDLAPPRVRLGIRVKPVGMFVGFFVAVTVADARTWMIEADGSGDAPTIQAAFLSAAPQDTINVGLGVYPGGLLLTGGKPVYVISRFGPAVTVLDGEYQAGVVSMDDGVLEGFTIRRGAGVFGAGVRIGSATSASTPILRNNTIEFNTAVFLPGDCLGAGIYVVATGARIEGNIIRNNHVSGSGGGIWDQGVETVIERNLIIGNSATAVGGGLHSGGGAIRLNLIADNHASITASGASIAACVEFRNNTIVGNSTGPGHGRVAGVNLFLCEAIGNLVAYNRANGNSISISASDPATVRCTNLWGNDNDQVSGVVDPSNFSADPLFCDSDPMTTMNFLLRENSPCVARNTPDPSCGLVGAYGVGCGAVSVQELHWGDVKQLFR